MDNIDSRVMAVTAEGKWLDGDSYSSPTRKELRRYNKKRAKVYKSSLCPEDLALAKKLSKVFLL